MENNFVISQQKSSVLPKVYGLLAASLIPTAIGAYLGMAINFAATGWIGFLILLAATFGVSYGIQKASSGVAMTLLFGFTFLMGMFLSTILQFALNSANGGSLVVTAAAMTFGVFVIMSMIGATTKKDLSGMGSFLFVGLILLIIGGLANIFFQIPLLSLVLSGVGALLFSLYILFDINNIVQHDNVNPIQATLSLYLNIINLFMSLLNILMALSGNSRD